MGRTVSPAPARYEIDPRGTLTVRGTTSTLLPYEVEITDRTRALNWRRALDGRQYHRLCVGNKPITQMDVGGETGDVHEVRPPHVIEAMKYVIVADDDVEIIR